MQEKKRNSIELEKMTYSCSLISVQIVCNESKKKWYIELLQMKWNKLIIVPYQLI